LRFRDERGFALVMAIAIMAMLSLGVLTSIVLTSSGQSHAFRSNGGQKGYALAEDGVNSAAAVVFAADNRPPTTANCLDPVWAVYGTLLSPRTTTRPEGSVTWSGQFVCNGPAYVDKYWLVTSIAKVNNPSAPGDLLTRVVKVKIPLDATAYPTTVTDTVAQTIPLVETVMDTVTTTAVTTRTITTTSTTYDDPGFSSGSFFYSWGDINACGGTGGIELSTSIITDGNFCMSGGNAEVQASAATVSVRGTITLNNNPWLGMGPTPPPTLVYGIGPNDTVAVVSSSGTFPSSVGMFAIDGEYIRYTGITTQSNKCNNLTIGPGQACFQALQRGFVPERPAAAHAAGAQIDGRLADVETLGGCVSGCTNVHAKTFRTGASAQLVTIVKPTIDVAGARRDAAPGPNHLPGGSCPIVFATTTNAYYNGATVDLTPTTSYTCTATGPGGAGELSWNNTTHELRVRGAVFIPANVVVSQDLYYTTFDSGAAYASGVMYIAGTLDYSQHNICALRVGSTTDCDTRTWNPNVHSELAIVMPNLPGQTGIASNPSHSITALQNAQFQGFIYTDGTVNRAGGNGFISGTVYSAGMTMQGGASTAPAPGVFKLPTGVQGQPRVTTTVTTTTETTTVPTTVARTTTGSTTVYSTTTHAATTTTAGPTAPKDFGG
jgi:hypothetical protein